ncbi:sulfate transporter [Brachyspira hyodysenteriae]|uniref:DUF3164 family protein n=1 Tax=Brachyspira hyodysenteriae TaxID=159 RepID=UPI00063D910A|nr:DUF3164 family protein [Brachyspira hyodysenteriae]KLI19583.1 sulfate transporter [Brachyspira hyodysenteriae]TVL67067.1 sulfate transporter [Brachyspira hyodysenteriae]TVL77095.1 sulfate transporter [Brachyspira hyodysenteriae]TVL86595.1 sulfate transporter [Brachyspira hyodysenteriae]
MDNNFDESKFMKNAQGAFIPIENVKPVDKLRDDLVKNLMYKTKEVQKIIEDHRNICWEDIKAFLEISASEHNVKYGGEKGNITLLSYDGKYKVIIANQDYISFNEKLQIAKDLIDECIRKWAKGADKNLLALVNDAFKVDKQGKISTEKILGLRRLEINDFTWNEAMKAITESITVEDSKRYIRFYERREKDGKYEHISLSPQSL